jgi:hypothetical protein
LLGLGVAEAWAALVAISAGYHGCPENVANCVAEGGWKWTCREIRRNSTKLEIKNLTRHDRG